MDATGVWVLNPVHPIQGIEEDAGFIEGIYNLEET